MATRISGLDGGSIATAGNSPTEQIQRTPAGTATTQSSPVQSDEVAITDVARLLAHLSKAAGGAPPIDQARVESLRQAIESGQYTINAERVANGLLAMERSLGSRT